MPPEASEEVLNDCLRLLLEQMPVLIALADIKGNLLMASAQHSVLEGWRATRALAKGCRFVPSQFPK